MKKLSVIIPCFNEENNIKELLDRLNNITITNIEKEIIVIDDCSSDSSKRDLKENDRVFNKKTWFSAIKSPALCSIYH